MTLEGQALTLFPGEVPRKVPDEHYWQERGFEFTSFRPMQGKREEPLPHIRVDKALEFLLGDKLL